MRILLVNDDGIDAGGIKAQVNALKGKGELHVVAPIIEQSGAAMAVTLGRPIMVEERDFEGAASAYAVDGTPVDCVKLALNSLFSEKPDLIISGINHGSNLGINVHYSGTVAAVIEGASQGVPGIAVSVPRHGPADFPYAAQFIARMVERTGTRPFPVGTILNINFPIAGKGFPRGVRLTRQCPAGITESHEMKKDSEGRKVFRLIGKVSCVGTSAKMDNSAIKAGYISITPLTIDLTDDGGFAVTEFYRFDNFILEANI